MQIYRMPPHADSTGDAIPFYHEGQYHIFSLTPAPGTTVYPARLRTTWSHAVSNDLLQWTQLETALTPGEGDEPDASGVWTGSVLYGEGQYHIFYTGYHIEARFQQTICHAISPDGIHWTKDADNPVIVPNTDVFEPLDWRDPYAFFNEEDHCYWLILSARQNSGPSARRGCVVLYRSDDLAHWSYYGPIYQPNHTNCPECPEMYRIGDNWYLSYSRFSEWVNTIYRIAKSPFGPWRTPKLDGIGGRRFYAAKSLQNAEGRRFYFGWAHDRAERSDNGEWYWGGAFCLPHEVVARPDGELDVKLPCEFDHAFTPKTNWTYQPILGHTRLHGLRLVEAQSPGTLSYGFFKGLGKRVMLTCKVRPLDVPGHFGFVLKSDAEMTNCLMLQFEKGMQRVSLVNLPMDVDPFWVQSCQSIYAPKQPGPDGPRVCERPFPFENGDEIDMKLLIDGDMLEIFIDERAAFTYRSYAPCAYPLGLYVQDGVAEFYDIVLSD